MLKFIGNIKVVCLQGAINKEGVRTNVDKLEVGTFDNITQAIQFLENNAVELISQGWKYNYHVSREAKPGEVCTFKEWQKDFDDGSRIEMFYMIE